jgi:UDP-N-acetylmuramate dehydrogenase
MAATLPSIIKIRENVTLRDFTTFRTGGPARFFCEVAGEAELAEAFLFAKENGGGKGILPIFILGGGSNILVGDAGFAGLVIKMNVKGMDFSDDGKKISVGAGENWDEFVGQSISRGFSGAENLSGIPGTVGAAPVQNIGAYGIEVAAIIDSVHAFDVRENSWKNFSAAECGFEYRDSVFKKAKGRYVITSVVFNLAKVGADAVNIGYKDLADYFAAAKQVPTPSDVREAVLAIRAKKLPDVREIGTAGSFFKNPLICEEHYQFLKKQYPDMPSFPAGESEGKKIVKVPLAWILDHVCGYKGVTKGNVGTYKNQALVIVNNFSQVNGLMAGATAAEIKNLAAEISAAVKEKTNIDIEPEVQYV